MVALIDQVADISLHQSFILIIRQLNILRLDGNLDSHLLRVQLKSFSIQPAPILRHDASLDDIRQAHIQNRTIVLQLIILINLRRKNVRVILCNHNMDVVRLYLHTDAISHLGSVDRLSDNLIFP